MIDHRSQEGTPMRRAVLMAITAVLAMTSQKHRLETVGPTEDGGYLLSTGWRIKPAGTTIPLSTLPMAQALAPDGRMLAALNAGFAPASIKPHRSGDLPRSNTEPSQRAKGNIARVGTPALSRRPRSSPLR